MDDFSGYRGPSLSILKKSGASVGDIVDVTTDWGSIAGTLVPRYQFDDDSHLVIKLKSGYNVGISVKNAKKVTKKAKGEKPAFKPPALPPSNPALPKVSILGTGGTIASRVDYRTGAVRPATTAEELYALIPELSEIARIAPKIVFSMYSENMDSEAWSKLASNVDAEVKKGADGVVITHGTDTMGYTAAALSFALQGVPVPVVLTAAQRSSDRPSTDAVLNLIAAVSVAARAEFSGVFVAMHESESDGNVAIHGGTRVRKNHTSRRDAFESIGVPLAAVWTQKGLEIKRRDLPKRGSSAFEPKPKFEPSVSLVKFYPSMPPTVVDSLTKGGIRALVIEGTGMGHINTKSMEAVSRFIIQGGLVFMTSQCINGRVDMNVYETGRDLLAAGVIPLDDMLSETALVKAMWSLANASTSAEAAELMTRTLVGEMTQRSA
jgi:glutamyl-tRNA(Gln) amidotransferase subunit D